MMAILVYTVGLFGTLALFNGQLSSPVPMASSPLPVGFLREFVALRLFSAISLTVVLYEHLITFDDELHTIWINPNTRWHSKLVFVSNRYLTEAVLCFTAYLFTESATTLNETVCLQFIWLYGIACVIFSATSHFVMVLRIYRLWDHRNDIVRNLTAMFAVFLTATIILGVFAVKNLHPSYVPSVRTCVLTSKPRALEPLFAVTCSFDLALLSFIVFNAMDRPRPTSVPIVSELQKDGVGIFVVLFVIRLANLMVAVFCNVSITFVSTTTSWALTTIVNARFQMRLEGLVLAAATIGPVVMFHDM